MASSQAPRLYRETRLNLEPAYPNSIIDITLPSPSASRPHATRTTAPAPSAADEPSFASAHLATSSSLFLRAAPAFPRALLWRVLSDARTLALHAVDLTQDRRNRDEARLTLRLRFPAPLRPFGVALASAADRDAVCVFAVTGRELWTLTLPRAAWARADALEGDEWWKVFRPSTWLARSPYRLVACSARCLVVSVDNGGLVRLERKAGESGAVWRETIFIEGRWGTLRGMVPWKGNTVRFGNDDLSPSCAAAMAMAPSGEHLITVGLDHMLKIWNLQTGKVGVQTDILGHNDKDAQRTHPSLIGAAQPQLMQVVEADAGAEGDLFYVVTYSPQAHEFKFWGVRDADTPTLGIYDLKPELELVPPVDELMDTNVWNMEEFHVKAGKGWSGSELWIRVRSGPNSQVYMLRFDLSAADIQLNATWKQYWVAVDAGSLTVEALRHSSEHPPDADPYEPDLHAPSRAEQWLAFLFHPGRFTVSTLETALHVLRQGSWQTKEQKKVMTGAKAADSASLQERICIAVAAKATITRTKEETLDYDWYEQEVGGQWQVFYGLVKDLHRRRGEALGMVYDTETDLPWVVRADCVCAVRQCSEPEILTLNQELLITKQQPSVSSPLSRALQDRDSVRVAWLLSAARTFRSGFPSAFQRSLATAVRVEALQDPSHSILDRLRAFDLRCELSNQISDEDLAQLTEALGPAGNLTQLGTPLLEAALRRLDEPQRGHHQQRAELTQFGARALARGAQETLNLGREMLLDVLVLVVFAAGECESNDEPCPFDKATLFDALITRLRDHELLMWMARTTRPERVERRPDSDTMRAATSSTSHSTAVATGTPSSPVLTLLESIFIGDWATMKFPSGPLSGLLTYWARAWTFRAALTQPYDDVAAHVMGYLLKHGAVDLAIAFRGFVPDSPWGCYLKARLGLAVGDLAGAARGFAKCAFGLSMGFFDVAQHDLTELLDLDERDHFADGLARFHQHVLALFEQARAYTYVADVASLALQALAATPPSEDTDAIRSDLLSRLFNASIRTARFEDAYAALTRFTNPALRRSSLQTLVTALASHPTALPLLTHTFPALALASDIDAALATLAARSLPSASASAPPYHRILYAFRIARGDFRGAAAALWEHLLHLLNNDTAGEERRRGYLLLINALACVAPDQAWIVAEAPSPLAPAPPPSLPPSFSRGELGGKKVGEVPRAMSGALQQKGGAEQKRSRGVVTLEEVRRMYQEELDREEAMEAGRFAFWDGREEGVAVW